MKDTFGPDSRTLNLQGDLNFRDFGGYITSDGNKIKSGLLYRSATLSRLVDEDVPSVEAIGLNRILDLRTQREIDREGYDKIYQGNESKFDFLHFNYGDPYLINAQISSELQWDMKRVDFTSIYINMLEQNKPAIKYIFDRFADSKQYPILIHCTQGKDRTGIVVALLLLVLNVHKEVVFNDYMLTGELVDVQAKLDEMDSYLHEFYDLVPPGVTSRDWAPFFVCLPDSLEHLFDHLEAEYGNAATFLNTIGVDQSQLQDIRSILLADTENLG